MSALFTPLKLALICNFVALSAQLIASVLALSQVKKADSYHLGWVLLTLGFCLMLVVRLDSIYQLIIHAIYILSEAFLALIISVLLMFGVLKIRKLFDFMHVQGLALNKLAKYDTLTGALRRYALLDHGLMAVKYSIRKRKPIAVLVLDIDKFKSLNDKYGHSFGDKILKRFVELCKNTLRNVDIFGRFGGDEFIAILPEANLEIALSVVQRIDAEILNSDIMFNHEKLDVTASIGIGVYDPDCIAQEGPKTAEELLDFLIHKADLSMYVVKKARNSIIESAKN